MISVPNTTNFSVQDVYNSVSSHAPSTTRDFLSCFNNAIPAYFDPTYNNDGYAVPRSVKRFRNYTPVILIPEFLVINNSYYSGTGTLGIAYNNGSVVFEQNPSYYFAGSGNVIGYDRPNKVFAGYYVTNVGTPVSSVYNVTDLNLKTSKSISGAPSIRGIVNNFWFMTFATNMLYYSNTTSYANSFIPLGIIPIQSSLPVSGTPMMVAYNDLNYFFTTSQGEVGYSTGFNNTYYGEIVDYVTVYPFISIINNQIIILRGYNGYRWAQENGSSSSFSSELTFGSGDSVARILKNNYIYQSDCSYAVMNDGKLYRFQHRNSLAPIVSLWNNATVDYFYDIIVDNSVMYGLCRNISTNTYKIVTFSSGTSTTYNTYRNLGTTDVHRFFLY